MPRPFSTAKIAAWYSAVLGVAWVEGPGLFINMHGTTHGAIRAVDDHKLRYKPRAIIYSFGDQKLTAAAGFLWWRWAPEANVIWGAEWTIGHSNAGFALFRSKEFLIWWLLPAAGTDADAGGAAGQFLWLYILMLKLSIETLTDSRPFQNVVSIARSITIKDKHLEMPSWCPIVHFLIVLRYRAYTSGREGGKGGGYLCLLLSSMSPCISRLNESMIDGQGSRTGWGSQCALHPYIPKGNNLPLHPCIRKLISIDIWISRYVMLSDLPVRHVRLSGVQPPSLLEILGGVRPQSLRGNLSGNLLTHVDK